ADVAPVRIQDVDAIDVVIDSQVHVGLDVAGSQWCFGHVIQRPDRCRIRAWSRRCRSLHLGKQLGTPLFGGLVAHSAYQSAMKSWNSVQMSFSGYLRYNTGIPSRHATDSSASAPGEAPGSRIIRSDRKSMSMP